MSHQEALSTEDVCPGPPRDPAEDAEHLGTAPPAQAEPDEIRDEGAPDPDGDNQRETQHAAACQCARGDQGCAAGNGYPCLVRTDQHEQHQLSVGRHANTSPSASNDRAALEGKSSRRRHIDPTSALAWVTGGPK